MKFLTFINNIVLKIKYLLLVNVILQITRKITIFQSLSQKMISVIFAVVMKQDRYLRMTMQNTYGTQNQGMGRKRNK